MTAPQGSKHFLHGSAMLACCESDAADFLPMLPQAAAVLLDDPKSTVICISFSTMQKTWGSTQGAARQEGAQGRRPRAPLKVLQDRRGPRAKDLGLPSGCCKRTQGRKSGAPLKVLQDRSGPRAEDLGQQ